MAALPLACAVAVAEAEECSQRAEVALGRMVVVQYGRSLRVRELKPAPVEDGERALVVSAVELETRSAGLPQVMEKGT